MEKERAVGRLGQQTGREVLQLAQVTRVPGLQAGADGKQRPAPRADRLWLADWDSRTPGRSLKKWLSLDVS